MIAFGLVLLVASAWAATETPTTLTVYGVEHGIYSGPIKQKPITLLDVHVRPVIVLAEVNSSPVFPKDTVVKDTTIPKAPINLFGKEYTAYYLHYGLRSVKDYQNHDSLFQYFVKSDALSGLAFFPETPVFNPSFLKNFVNKVVLPDNFNIFELVKALAYPVPVLIVSPKSEFSTYDFRGIIDIGTFVFGSEGQFPGQQIQPSHGGQVPYYPNPYVYPTLFIPTTKEPIVQGIEKPNDVKLPVEIPDKEVPTPIV